MTQEKAAKALKMSALHYDRLERGQRRASLEQLDQIASLFGIPFEDLLAGAVDSYPTNHQKASNAPDRTVQLLSEGCSDQAHSLMIDLCKVVAFHDKHPSPGCESASAPTIL